MRKGVYRKSYLLSISNVRYILSLYFELTASKDWFGSDTGGKGNGLSRVDNEDFYSCFSDLEGIILSVLTRYWKSIFI